VHTNSEDVNALGGEVLELADWRIDTSAIERAISSLRMILDSVPSDETKALTTLKSYPAVLTPPRKGSPPDGGLEVDVLDGAVVVPVVDVEVAVPGKH
jgi:hypothetical protein